MSDVHPVTVTLNGKTTTYTREFQTEQQYEGSWQSALQKAYGRAELTCGCRGVGGPKRLAVKYYEGSNQYSLARFSLTGAQHATNCQFYSSSQAHTGPGGDALSVIDQQPDGSIKIRLDIALVQRDNDGPPSVAQPPSPTRPSTARQSSMKLLGLLHYLWDEAGLTQWRPAFAGKRTASFAYWRLNAAAEDIWVGDVKLVEQLLLPAAKATHKEATRNTARTAAALAAKHRMLIVAPLASFSEDQAAAMSQQLKISGFHGMPLAYMQDGLWDTTKRRFPRALAAWEAGHTTVAIAQIELREGTKATYAKVIDMAIMSVTAEFIPVESSYERTVADLLVVQGRSFSKPLRYSANSDQVFPDFILTDTARETPMEVFGRNDSVYLLRKQEKTAYYDAQFGPTGWWSWDACNSVDGAIPPFPPAR